METTPFARQHCMENKVDFKRFLFLSLVFASSTPVSRVWSVSYVTTFPVDRHHFYRQICFSVQHCSIFRAEFAARADHYFLNFLEQDLNVAQMVFI